MGKTVKKIGLAIGATGLLFASGGLSGPLIFGLSSFQVAAVGFAVASFAGGFIRPKTDPVESLGTRLTLGVDPSAPRMICYGKAATAGTLVYREATGSNNETLYLVIALAGHEIESIESFTWGGVAVTFSSNNAVGDLNNLMFRYDKLGLDAQTVQTTLEAASSKWTTAHRLRGIAYIVLRLVYDREKNNQIKNPVCTIKGLKLYDPRLDTSRGGSGSHQTDDHSTWGWSDNPALCIASYLMGVRVANSATDSYDGQIIAGMGIDPERIDWANIIAEANSCDESVALNGGGSENRYTCNGFIDPRRSHRQNLQALASSMGGAVVFQGGKWRIYAAVSRAAVKTRDETDMLSGLEYRAKKSRAEKANAVRGVYADVDAEFQPRDITPLINSTYVAEDGDDELWMDVNLPFTTSGTMAQRLAKIALERSRMDKMVTGSFGPIALQDQAMDSLTFSYTPLGLSGQKMRVADWALAVTPDDNGNTGLTFPVTLLEEDDAIYAWDETTDEQAISTTVTVTRVEHNTSTIASGDLASGVGVDQGDGTVRNIAFGKTTVQGRDGDGVTFVNAYDEAPGVEFTRGGGTFDGTGLSNTAIHQASIKALNVTASGFTIQAKLKETASGITAETDGDGTGTETAWNSGNGPTDPDWQGGKENSAEAWNDEYEWAYDVTATDFLVDFVEVGFYTNINAAGWVKQGASGAHFSTSTDVRETRAIDGMGTTGPDGDLYGMDVESFSGDGDLDDVEAVRWDRAASPATVSATPPGADPVVFIVAGGAE